MNQSIIQKKGSRLISHAVARERTKPRRENDELLYYSIQRFFDDSFISTILFLSLSLLFYFSPCFHRILPYFSLYPLRLIILFFHLMTEHTYTQIAYTQICTQWIACEWLENAERERLIVYRAVTFDANRFRFFLFFSVLHVTEEKRGKFDMYFFSNDFRELCSYLIMFFIVRYLKKKII